MAGADGAGVEGSTADRYRAALEALVGVPATEGNAVDVLRNGSQAFPAMLEAVRTATTTVDLHTFGYWNGSVAEEFTDALGDRAAAGVRVRVLFDSLGARRLDHGLIDRMVGAGVQVEWFRPLANWRITQSTHRGHRRLLICDSRVAFAGGIGIDDGWRGDGQRDEWRDTNVAVRGPAVNGLRGAFLNNWAETGQSLFEEMDDFPEQKAAGSSAVQVVRGDSETGWGDLSTLVRSLMGLARHRLRISSSYFVPDDEAFSLLCQAAGRGVEVDLLRPGPHVMSRLSQLACDAQCDRLLGGGIRVWEYQPSVMRANVVIVDGIVASVGAVNFNSRSLTLDDEVNVVVFDPDVVTVLDAHFDDDVSHSTPLDASDWRRRHPARRAVEGVPGFLARRL